MNQPTRIGLIGCGNIAGQYLNTIQGVADLQIVGAVDLDQERAKAFAEEHQVPFVATAEELFSDPEVDLILNLTIHHAHFAITKAALEAGKHVFSEKPLTMNPEEAHELVRIAAENGVRLGCAPVTFLGEAQQTFAQQVREGALGDIRLVYAEVNHGRIESWHPAPAAFYEVGPIWDVAPYPLALVTSILGPIRSVCAHGAIVMPERETQDGEAFTLQTPDVVIAILSLASGATVRLTANFYVGNMTPSQQNIEFHGVKGSGVLSSWFGFDADVKAGDFGEALVEVPLAYPEAYTDGIEWSRGLQDMAAAIREDRPHRCSGEHAAHVTEVLFAINRSVDRNGEEQQIDSEFPLPLPWEPIS